MLSFSKLPLLLAAGALVAAGAPADSGDLETVLEEMRTIRKELGAAGQRLDNLGRNATVTASESLSDEEASELIKGILGEVDRTVFVLPGDPRVATLRALGSQHIDAIIEHMNQDNAPVAVAAINNMATDEQRDLIVRHLTEYPQLFDVVNRKGWLEEAHDMLLRGLTVPGIEVPQAWIEWIVLQREPASYPLLLEYMMHTENPAPVYQAIEELPGLDLSSAVVVAWQNVKENRDHQCFDTYKLQFAKIAARYGHLDALAALFEDLDDSTSRWGGEGPASWELVQELTRAPKNPQAAQKWFGAHRDRLRWDRDARRYVLD